MKERAYITTDSSKQSIILNKIPVLHLFAKISYSVLAVAKSIASREKLNNLLMANDSTPLTRAFFVRNLRTPKINLVAQIERLKFNLSMVGRIGQSLVAGCVPLVAVSHPDTLYRPAVRSKAVDIKNLLMELSQMFYKFLFIGSRLHITVYARINPNHHRSFSQTKVCPNLDTPPTEQKSILPKNQSTVSIGGTTTIEGKHYPYSSAFFISQNPFNNIAINWRCLSIDFAKWSICRDKAEFIRTNKASRSIAVVEAISHPINRGDTNHLLTKQLRTIKMLFKFILLLGENRLKLAIRAHSEQQARNLLNLQSNALFVARINDKGGIYA